MSHIHTRDPEKRNQEAYLIHQQLRRKHIELTNLIAVEAWTVFVTGLHDECTEEDVRDIFADAGPVRHLYLGRDHRTASAKGHAILQYARLEEAQRAVKSLDGATVMGQPIRVFFCFKASPSHSHDSF